jgi:DNA-directed RNA polymerase subunit RPC12/RpoP
MSKYEYKCMTCDHIYWFDHSQSYKNCKKCKDSGELRLKSIRHDDVEEYEEPEMPEDGWKCSECGAPVENMNDVCSRSCFNAMMR